ncbi:MAG TPA: M24 family metallopeptidase [Microlunatus sp.]|nr:M24 family metallopeptidase [Microlunatus sp.]
MSLPTPSPDATDRAVKRGRLIALLDRVGADRLILRSSTTLSWYLDGARTHVSLAAPPIAVVVAGRDGDRLLTTDNESDRLSREELPADIAVEAVPWYRPLPVPQTGRTISEDDVAEDLRRLRVPLLPQETARYRTLSKETARLLTCVLRTARPERTERQLAAEVTAGIVDLGAEPLVVLVGGASRQLVRHPLPTEATLGRRALVVVCARRHGLIVNLSRTVVFGAPTDEEADAHRRILAVEAAFLDACVPGLTIADVFADGCAAYAGNGFDAEEWTRHHQGGAAGYAGRDPRASAEAGDPVVLGQAFAWNPTGQGAKVEDTVLLTSDGLQVLTVDPAWPTLTVAGRARPDVLAV